MSILEMAIGLLAPPDCIVCGIEGSALCQGCKLTEIIPFGERCYSCNKMSPDSRTCPSCRPSSPSHIWISTEYQNSAKDLIQNLKFKHQRSVALPIAELMVSTLEDFVSEDDIEKLVIVPVPTATSRVRERSFDHSALLAREISKKLDIRCSHDLKRLGQSRQVGAKRETRRQQIDGSYFLLKNNLRGKKILLIDDVVTTGATLRAATKVLRRAGVRSVDALVFAKKL